MQKLPLPDEHPNAVSALRNKRAEIAGLIAMHDAEITRLRSELIHLDATLRLFDPVTDPNDIGALRRLPRKTEWFARGEIADRIYGGLRSAGEVSPTALADQALQEKGIADRIGRVARRDTIARFSSMLYTMTRRGQLVKISRSAGARWQVAPREANLI
jgi:hypothetical protein